MSNKIPKPGDKPMTEADVKAGVQRAMLERIARMPAHRCESMLEMRVSTPIALALRARLAVLDPMLLN